MVKRFRLFLLLLLTWMLPVPALGQFEEYSLKAVFMEKFTHFIEWPNDSEGVFKICVIGENPFEGALQSLMALSKFNDKDTTFTNVNKPNVSLDCDMLFISRSKKKSLNKILEYVRTQPVLTISDTEGFSQQGVMINFVQKRGQIHFEINQYAAEAVGLKISSRLLKLAIITSSPNQKTK